MKSAVMLVVAVKMVAVKMAHAQSLIAPTQTVSTASAVTPVVAVKMVAVKTATAQSQTAPMLIVHMTTISKLG
ncbi:MAG: hypothetical protein NTY08_06915 [Proteobacteria bacterium]|nr:hypothetical protein [Pseudomonadota bacterium]